MKRIKQAAAKVRMAFMPIPTSPYIPSGSDLLSELLAMNQPIEVCYSSTETPQYYLDLDQLTLYHKKRSSQSRSLYVDRSQTNNNLVVLCGILEDHTMWCLSIKRRPPTKKGQIRHRQPTLNF